MLSSSQHNEAPSQPKGIRGRVSVGGILYFFGLSLLLADFFLLRSDIGGNLGKALNYGLRLFIGASVVVLVLLEIFTPRRRKFINVLLGFFLLVCAAAFMRWVANGEATLTTILGNPNFSIFVWTFVLAIDLSSRHRLQPNLLHQLGQWSPASTMVVGWLFFFAAEILKINFYYPVFFLLICIQLCLRSFNTPRKVVEYVIASVGAFALFAVTDYRAYALAIVAVLMFRMFNLGKARRAFFASLVILALPMAYMSALDYFGGFEFYIGDKNTLIDTRSFLMIELFEDMKPLDYLIGKGLDGTYFSPYFYSLVGEAQNNADFYQRSGLEMGVLNILLKLGAFGLIPFLLIYFISLFAAPKWMPSREIQNLRLISLTFFFLFTIEAPQAVNGFYFLWFYLMGLILSGSTSKAIESASPANANRGIVYP